MKDDTSKLTKLGSKETEYEYAGPNSGILESFPNQAKGTDYLIELTFPEFTSLCPRTGQPDFGSIRITYIPNEWCVESKSLKLYLFSWRNEGSFMETIVNRILRDIVEAVSPKWCEVVGEFNPRGGVRIVVNSKTDYTEGQD